MSENPEAALIAAKAFLSRVLHRKLILEKRGAPEPEDGEPKHFIGPGDLEGLGG
jgi:hypothetical protein